MPGSFVGDGARSGGVAVPIATPPALFSLQRGGCGLFCTRVPMDMETFVLIMLIAGFVCFLAATFSVATRFNLVAAGLAFWILTALVPALDAAL